MTATNDAALAAAMLVGALDGMAQAVVDPEAGLTAQERDLIEPPLGRILDRLSPEMAEKIAILGDPVLLAFGLGLWSLRLIRLQQAKKPERKAEPAPIMAEGNGNGNTEVISDKEPAVLKKDEVLSWTSRV